MSLKGTLQKPIFGRFPRMGHPLSKGLVGLWLMNEGSQGPHPKVFDLSENGNDGILDSGTVWGSAKYGSGLVLNGVDDNLNPCGATKQLFSAYPFTLVIWVKTIGDNQYIFGLTDVSESDTYYYLHIVSGTANLVTRNTTHDPLDSGVTVNDGIWHQIVGVWVSDTLRHIYVDGIWCATQTDNYTYNTAVDSWSIGCLWRSAPAGYLACDIDHTLAYNRIVPASEIALLYREPFCMFDRDMIELWSAATLGAAPVGAAGIMTTNTGFWGPTY